MAFVDDPSQRPVEGVRVVLVTGASSGIGRASAVRAAEAGHRVCLVARSEETLEEVRTECVAAGARSVDVHALDVADDAAVEAAVAKILAQHGRIDGVIHAAGVVSYGRTEDVPQDVFESVVSTNLFGTATLVRHVLPVMRAQRAGTFVQVGSLLGHIAVPGMSPYVVSKWGARALVRQLQIENRDVPGLHICDLVPGGVDTPIYDKAANYSDRVGRAPFPVSPETVARVAVGLLTAPRRTRHVGPLNRAIVAGFWAAPRLFDALVGPLFRLAASDGKEPVDQGAGNV